LVTLRGLYFVMLDKKIEKSELIKLIPKEVYCDYLNKNFIKISSYKKDQIIHFEGDFCRNLEVIIEGKASIERIDETGNLFTIAELHNENILGGNLLFSKNPYYPMTITAKSDTLIIEIQKHVLFDLFIINKKFLNLFLQLISDNTLILGDKIKNYANRSARERICNYLKQEYYIQNSLKISLNISKKSLAERIGIQRTSLSRELQKMKNEELLLYDSKSITILNKNILIY